MATTTSSGGRAVRHARSTTHFPGRPTAFALALLAAFGALAAPRADAQATTGAAPAPGAAASAASNFGIAPPPVAAPTSDAVGADAAAAPAGRPPVLRPTVGVSVIASDNVLLAPKGQGRTDAVGEVQFDLLVRSSGARVTLQGDIAADAITYARDSGPTHVLPRGDLTLDATLVERALFFQSEVSAGRTRADPLGPALATGSTANTVSTVTWRASPYFQHDFTPTVSAFARSDTVVTRNHSEDPDIAAPLGSLIQREIVRVERKPVPIGLLVEASREETSYQGSSQSALVDDNARAGVTLAVDPEVLLGAYGGRDHTAYNGLVHDDSVYGGLMQWHPSSRLQFDVDAQHRFFGTAWNAHLRDRTPQFVVDLTFNRAAEAAPASIALPAAQTDPSALLNSLLSTRVPNADARGDAVDQVSESRGLPSGFAAPIDIFTQLPQLTQSARAEVLFNGVRNSVLGSLYYLKAQALPGLDPVPGQFDSRQWGGSVGWYHRLTPLMSVAAEGSYVDVQALGDRAGDSSRQSVATLSLTRMLNRQATLSCGVRRLDARVTLQSVGSAYKVSEDEIFAGLRMQY